MAKATKGLLTRLRWRLIHGFKERYARIISNLIEYNKRHGLKTNVMITYRFTSMKCRLSIKPIIYRSNNQSNISTNSNM